MSKRYYKYKLILDENVPSRRRLASVNERYDVKHIRDDFHPEGTSDPEVYNRAVEQKRVLVTYNVKHFKPLAGSQDDCGIIGLPPNVPRQKLDLKLVAFLTRTTPAMLYGHYVPLSRIENTTEDR
jgi:predicted nuclease of predicted toxin-antitoxin system